MELIKIIGVGLITSIAILVVKQVKPEIAIVITITGSLVMLLMLVEMLSAITSVFDILVNKTGIDKELFTSILKIIGIGYITEFSSNICIDSGNTTISDKILLAGKIAILVLALPIITALVDIIVSIMP
jgi:stage III sporulation protein AD